MTMTPEMIAAYADGELAGAEARAVELAIAQDPALAEEVSKHRQLKAMLAGHYAPILERDLPESITGMLSPAPSEVVDFAAAKQKRERKRTLPGWGWVAGPALAASLAIAVFLPRGEGSDLTYADGQLAAALETQLVATQSPGDATQILLSFTNRDGAYCRAFTGSDQSGIACRDSDGWSIARSGSGSERTQSEFRQAGNEIAAILAEAQAMASGDALDAEAEAIAREKGWSQ